MSFKIHIATAIATLLSTVALAQKPPLNHDVYDDWKNLSSPQISNSGQLIFYAITPQEGDAILEIKSAKNELLTKIDRGYDTKITKNEQHFVGLIKPLFSETREAKIKKKKADEMPKDSLFIFNVANRYTHKFAEVSSYKLARKNEDYVAFIAEIIPESPLQDSIEQVEAQKKPSPKKGKPEKVLHILRLSTGDTIQIPKADSYYWADDETQLFFTRKGDSKDSTSTSAGAYIYHIEDGQIKKISSGKGTYKNFAQDDQQRQLSFVADKSPEKSLTKDFKLYYYTNDLDSAIVLSERTSQGMPDDWYVSGEGSLSFSADGQKLYFAIAPIPLVRDTTLVDFEQARVDIWHWQDDYLQTQQLANLRRDQNQNYPAVIYPNQGREIIPLTDETFSRVQTTDDADHEWVLTTSNYGNRISAQWDTQTPADVYIISTKTGERRRIHENLVGYAFLSPTAEHVVLFDRITGSWHSHSITDSQTLPLGQTTSVSWVNEQHDQPSSPNSYGIAGWSKDGKTVYVYDRYDIWSFPLNGQQAKCLTESYGRDNKIQLRVAFLKTPENPRERTRYIIENEETLLQAFDETSKYNGFYATKLDRARKPKKIHMAPNNFRQVSSPNTGDLIIYTKEDYQHSADLYVNTRDFSRENRLTDINPQQQNYNWGTAELIQWTTPNGHQAEGILYKPENFDENKQYPIIAYFYERLSDGLYNYHTPAPTPSRLNIPFFVSNEYLVFAPDIRYEIGYPGRSAEEYINSGMRHLARNHTWVDSTKMGIQGQSWGGYQVAHLITRTDMYAAAWAGAPVVNMTSAYGGIRWSTGMSRQFQYENTQSRIGESLWDAHDLYIENSPLFFMDRVNTPVAVMHNDKDGAVPWYQGIEMFTALRRLQKPVWLLNYNDDEHNLIKRQNRKDIQIREQQFFDHFLKGKPAANWIKHGVPAVHKGIDWGLKTE